MPERVKQWFLPGVATLLFLLVLPDLFQASNQFLTDPATARHLRAGQIMLEQGQVLASDPFGVDIPPRPWLAFEWLFEMAVAGLVQIGGLPLAYAVGFLLFFLIPVILWRLLMQQRIPLPIAFLYVLSVSLFFRAHLLLRPLILTYLFMAVVVSWWYRRTDGIKTKDWFALPLLFAVWANIHGGFAAALLFLTLSLAGRIIDRVLVQKRALDRSRLTFIPLLIICFNATLITPHGWHLHRMIWEMVFHIKSFSQWNEFRAPDFAHLTPLAVAFLMVAITLLLGRVRVRTLTWSWETALPLLLFLYFGCKVQRHVLLLLIVAAVPVCREWTAWLNAISPARLKERLATLNAIEFHSRSHWWMIPVVGLFAVSLFLHSAGASHLRVNAKNITPESIEYIRAHREQFRRPLVTTWNAGALVYHLAPDFRITYDDRTEFYGDARLTPYIGLLRLEPGWEETLHEGKFDSAILDREFPITQALALLPDWKLVHEDELSVIYVRVNK